MALTLLVSSPGSAPQLFALTRTQTVDQVHSVFWWSGTRRSANWRSGHSVRTHFQSLLHTGGQREGHHPKFEDGNQLLSSAVVAFRSCPAKLPATPAIEIASVRQPW
ncbi:hypothetical protein PC121_g3593 [Phytophthora cactorum]|nr:hypothetical protein PC120_g2951 [Phytophthora cactorum]KAG3092426.1 hypothetical protein PC121_g3593 [Phytophthora cactorum]KAG4061357.1 hypothetical protein PC123_g3759 [Phytophthora cactorum]